MYKEERDKILLSRTEMEILKRGNFEILKENILGFLITKKNY